MLSNTLAFVMIVALIAALQAFDQIYVMTGGGPYGTTQTVVMEIYTSGFKKLELGFASALSYVLLLITLVLSLVQFRFFGRREKDAQ
jgi:multiple sugar transport system permease protein